MITVVILTKNESKNIEICLKSVKWCDEVIVIDDNSDDETVKIAKKYKAKVFLHSLENNYAEQRNFGLSLAKNEWILFIDADEIVSDALAYEISNAIQLKDHNLRSFNGFYLKRRDFMWEKELKYGETGNISLLRLARKDAGLWEGVVHEKWKVNGLVGVLKNPLRHYPHQTVSEFLNRVNIYSNIRAEELRLKNKKAFFWSILAYPLGKFMVNYFIKRGFMDGIRGLIFAVFMSLHSFLVRGKLWLKTKE